MNYQVLEVRILRILESHNEDIKDLKGIFVTDRTEKTIDYIINEIKDMAKEKKNETPGS